MERRVEDRPKGWSGCCRKTGRGTAAFMDCSQIMRIKSDQTY